MKGIMKASALKSEGEARSQTRYHFVYGIWVGRVEWESKEAAVGALDEGLDENMGEGEGGEAKSSKSG